VDRSGSIYVADAGNHRIQVFALVTCGGLPATIIGTEGPDVLTGTSRPDVLHGFGGDDTLRGLGGDDTLCGGPGNDTLQGGSGDDALDGGAPARKGQGRRHGGTGGKGVCISYPFTLTARLLALATILVWSLSGRPASATLLISGKNFTMHGAACKAKTENATGVTYGYDLYASTAVNVICPLTYWTDNLAQSAGSGLTLHVGTNGTSTCTTYTVNASGTIFDTQTGKAPGSGRAKTVRFNKTFPSNIPYPYDPTMPVFVECSLPGNSAIYRLTWDDFQ
jgi:RTX calcium-binding nonapeptide repeat (4 copies)/NHL repeat